MGCPHRLRKVLISLAVIAAAIADPARTEDLFVRGDLNSDGRVDIADPILVLLHIFQGSFEPGCRDAGDANDDGRLDITDAIYSLQYLFRGGLPPELPFPECGVDARFDDLDCEAFPVCPPLENRIADIRRVNGGIEIELFSPAPFPARALYPVLCIGDQGFVMSRHPNSGTQTTIIFSLGEEEFALTSNGDPVMIQYGGCEREIEDMRPYWDLWVFGPLDRSLLNAAKR